MEKKDIILKIQPFKDEIMALMLDCIKDDSVMKIHYENMSVDDIISIHVDSLIRLRSGLSPLLALYYEDIKVVSFIDKLIS